MRGKEADRTRSREPVINWNALLLCFGVLAATFGILFWIHSYITQNTDQAIDTKRMRAIYSALFLYEGSDNEVPPSNLAVLAPDLGDGDWFRAVNDPWGQGINFQDKTALPPLDPAAFPNAPSNPFRISFTYLPMWVRYGGVKISDWRKEQLDAHLGLIACYWYGDIDRVNLDGRDSTGPVVRINMDGSATTSQRLDRDKLTARDMFGIR